MALAYDVVVGTGGIGSGMFLALRGNRTLGREESRAAVVLNQRDYCKLHIVCHYVRRLLGPAARVVPIGKVGDDTPGRDALAAMRAEGMDMSFVAMAPRPTLFSVCFLYPDGDGGNITTAASASDCVGPDDIRRAAPVLAAHPGRGIVVALPEVPVAARAALLDLGSAAGALRVATFVSQEWDRVLRDGLLARVDLLAVNLDEAAALVDALAAAAPTTGDGATAGSGAADDATGGSAAGATGGATASSGEAGAGTATAVVAAVVRRLAAVNPRMSLVVTAGNRGSWAWDGHHLTHAAALPAEPVASTAGAGDAHLAGLVVATAHGVPLAAANRYAAAVSGVTVMSPHTIDPDLTAERVRHAARSAGWQLPPRL